MGPFPKLGPELTSNTLKRGRLSAEKPKHTECPSVQNGQAGIQTQMVRFQGPALSSKVGFAHVVSETGGLAEIFRVQPQLSQEGSKVRRRRSWHQGRSPDLPSHFSSPPPPPEPAEKFLPPAGEKDSALHSMSPKVHRSVPSGTRLSGRCGAELAHGSNHSRLEGKKKITGLLCSPWLYLCR